MQTMDRDFELSMDWLDLGNSSPEEMVTSGMLKIRLKKWYASRHYDLASKTLVDSAKVSAYPMALWAAYNWWRLNYEPYSGPSYHWKSAHDLPAADSGYVWPPLRIVSSGETVSLRIMPPAGSETMADVQYASTAWGLTLARVQFERELSDFIHMIIARLTDTGHQETELHTLWQDVCRERQDDDYTFYRILEACLGHNPDKGSELLINKLADHEATAGRQAVIEIAVGMSKEAGDINKADDLSNILSIEGQGVLGKFNYGGFEPAIVIDPKSDKPWEIGHHMARDLRKRLGLNGRPVDDDLMAELLELPRGTISSSDVVQPLRRVNMSLGIPDDDGRVHFCLHRPERSARRFYLSRLLGEHLLNTKSPGNWLPATFGATWHQKYQRAFASELLCPIEVLWDRLGSDGFDDDGYEIERVAHDYGMGTFAVMNHWSYNQPKASDFFEDKYAQ